MNFAVIDAGLMVKLLLLLLIGMGPTPKVCARTTQPLVSPYVRKHARAPMFPQPTWSAGSL